MSNIRIDNIAPSAGGTYRNAPRGIAAAWVNFNGTSTVAIRDSENVGSITDIAAGQFTVNFTSNMANGDYATQVTSSSNNGYNRDGAPLACVAMNLTTPLVNVGGVGVMNSMAANGSGDDRGVNVMNITTHGDLA